MIRATKLGARAGELLLIEDTPSLQMLYSTILRKAGFHTYCAGSASEGIALYQQHKPKVVLLDLILPDRDGLELMRDLLARQPETRIIVITANGSVSKAVEATRAGACEFIVKPLGDVRLINAVANAFAEARRQRSDTDNAFGSVTVDRVFSGQSPAIGNIRKIIASVAKSTAPVFITGESGTGKKNCAKALHLKSSRSGQRFIPVNCASITADRLDAELLGPTASDDPDFSADIDSLSSQDLPAIRGTLFLDNITEMPLELQSKLLHLLQTSTYLPVGARRPFQVNARIIAASIHKPDDELRARRLREDLYYRLYVIPIQMPSLRDRNVDLAPIATGMLAQISAEEGKNFIGLSADVLDLFRELPWPGNLRQLFNVIRNIVVLNDGEKITLDMLPRELIAAAAAGGEYRAAPSALHDTNPGQSILDEEGSAEHGVPSGMTLAEIEKFAIERAIERHGGSVPRAARELGLAPSTIYRKREGWPTDNV